MVFFLTIDKFIAHQLLTLCPGSGGFAGKTGKDHFPICAEGESIACSNREWSEE
jgi:hypothetical protein